MAVLDAELTAAFSTFTGTFAKEVTAVNVLTAKQQVAAITMLTSEAWEKKRPNQ